MQETKTPVKIAVAAMITNIVLSLILLKPMKHSGLALANSAAASVNFIVLFFMLRKRLGRLDGRNIAMSFMKVSAASAATGLAIWSIVRGDMWVQGGRTVEKTAIMAGVVLFYLAAYVLIMRLLRSEELTYLVKMYKERKGKTDPGNP